MSSSSRRPSPDRRRRASRSKRSVRWGIAPQTLVLVLLLVPQLALEDLARRVAGQLVHEDDLARHLVARQVGLDEALEVLLRDVLALLRDDDRAQPLAEVVVVDAHDRDLLDGVVAREQLLD